MKIFYARPVSLFGTKQEARDFETLKQLGFDVVDPNNADSQERYQSEGVGVFLELVRGSDAVAFRSFPDGKIGAGICGQIDEALRMGKPIIELAAVTAGRKMSVDATREYLALLGQR